MLRSWIPIEKIDWAHLSENPHDGAVRLLEENPEKVSWNNMCKNTNLKALNLLYNKLRNTPLEFNWYNLSSNPSAVRLVQSLITNMDCVFMSQLCKNTNPEAIDMLSLPENKSKICWPVLSKNSGARSLLLEELQQDDSNIYFRNMCCNPSMIDVIEKVAKSYPEKIDWGSLSLNPEAIHLLQENPDKIHWRNLSENPAAIHLLEKMSEEDPDRLDWCSICKNPNAMNLLYNTINVHPDRIHWPSISSNPSIFEDEEYASK